NMIDQRNPRFRAMPFVLASAVSAALLLAAPFIGEIRRAILTRFPGHFVLIVGGIVALAVAGAILAAVRRVRDRRADRYGAIAFALVLAVAYAIVSRTGDPRVDAVERFHFVEFGLISLLFYRAWRPAADPSAIVLPVLAGLLVGTLDEWLQWFIPVRVGEVRDVFLNGVAIACGLIFSVALDPPVRFSPALSAASLRRIGAFCAAVLVVFAAFFQSVHLGYAIGGYGWSFRSCYAAPALDAMAADRANRWRGTFVDRPRRLSAEDQYMTEGHWHVARRNEAWAAEEVAAAWYENLILEQFFAPVLDTPSYLSRTGHRWSDAHRADAERRFADSPATGLYESDAHPSAIQVWSKTVYWLVVIVLAAILAAPWFTRRLRRGSERPAAPSVGTSV
ncbi:MAG: VanZ family protein, partial [Vicinamibacterales bacterium]